ncbi:MAG TPA: peptidoglycan DD-metalloendopeptidase family protein [Chitinophagales bacterium]|nr:peptidoglycan DD-metalloendopeptidase family protein [Chitinophagales bacterium]
MRAVGGWQLAKADQLGTISKTNCAGFFAMKVFVLPHKKKLFLRVALLFIFFLTQSQFSFSQNSKEDLEKKKEQLVKEISSLQKELDQTKKSKKSNASQLAALQKKIKARQRLITNYNSEIFQFDKEINNKVSTVRSLDRDLDTLKQNYAKMIYYAYKHRDAYNRLLFLFSASDFNEAFKRLKYINRFNSFRRQQAELIRSTTSDLKKQMTVLKVKKQSKQQLVNEQVQQTQKLAVEKNEKDKLVKSLSKQEKDLKANLDKKKKEQAALKKEIADLIKKEIEESKKKGTGSTTTAKNNSSSSSLALTPEAAALSAGFASNQGKLPWPVEKGEISDQFGTHTHAVFDNLTVKNNGVDITTAQGANVRAIFKGTVVGILSNPGYHKAVLVRHGEYFTVYSNLSSVKVKANDEVSTKQSLGTAYTDPSTGETMVHLEIWQGTTLLNPESWIIAR